MSGKNLSFVVKLPCLFLNILLDFFRTEKGTVLSLTLVSFKAVCRPQREYFTSDRSLAGLFIN